jgi:hypothetical protein
MRERRSRERRGHQEITGILQRATERNGQSVNDGRVGDGEGEPRDVIRGRSPGAVPAS